MTDSFFSTSANVQVDPERPSIFPIYASTALKEVWKPAFDHVTKFIVETLSTSSIILPDRIRGQLHLLLSDEAFTLLDLVLSHHFLVTYKSLFNEFFYGLKRTKINLKMTLISQVLIPYVLLKIERINAKMKQDLQYRQAQWYHKFVAALHPLINAVLRVLDICFTLAYSCGRTRFCSWQNCLANTEIVYITKDDEIQLEEKWTHQSLFQKGVHQFFSKGLEVMAFYLQFISFQMSNDFRAVSSNHSRPKAPAAQAGTNTRMNQCPICRTVQMRTPALLPRSGYVFCYKCIFDYIEDNASCPITKLPAKCKDLVRLFCK